jgi:hypothetical protein
MIALILASIVTTPFLSTFHTTHTVSFLRILATDLQQTTTYCSPVARIERKEFNNSKE